MLYQLLDYTVSDNGMIMNDKLETCGSSHCIVKILLHHLGGGTEVNHKNPQSGYLVLNLGPCKCKVGDVSTTV
jgi:hypothetical protein